MMDSDSIGSAAAIQAFKMSAAQSHPAHVPQSHAGAPQAHPAAATHPGGPQDKIVRSPTLIQSLVFVTVELID
jgi:hypothetical protein